MGSSVNNFFSDAGDAVEDVGQQVGDWGDDLIQGTEDAINEVDNAIDEVGGWTEDVEQGIEDVGDAFEQPEIPTPPEPASAEDIVAQMMRGGPMGDEPTTPERGAQAQQNTARRRLAAQETIRTSPQGVLEPAFTTRTLLGG